MTARDELIPELSASEAALLAGILGADAVSPITVADQDAFIQRVMQDVKARQRRNLLLDVMPLMLGAGLMMLALLILMPAFSTLPMLLPGAMQQLRTLAMAGETDAGVLLPIAVLLLALVLPGLLDRVQDLRA